MTDYDSWIANGHLFDKIVADLPEIPLRLHSVITASNDDPESKFEGLMCDDY